MNDDIPTHAPPAATPSALEWDPSRITEDDADELVERVKELIDAVSAAKQKVDYAIDNGDDEGDALAEATAEITEAQMACAQAQWQIPADAILGDLELALFVVMTCLKDPAVSDLDRAERAAEDALDEALVIEIEEDWKNEDDDAEEDEVEPA
jgi:hypothetical protein